MGGLPTGIATGSSAITIVAAGFPFFTNVTGAAASAVLVSATRHARSVLGNLIRIVGSSPSIVRDLSHPSARRIALNEV